MLKAQLNILTVIATALAMTTIPVLGLRAAEMVLEVDELAVISREEGETRYVIWVPSIEVLEGKRVLYAKCHIRLDWDSCSAPTLDLELAPITHNWNSVGASWESPWDSAGGDYESDFAKSGTVLTGSTAGILVTDVLQAWANGAVSNLGLIMLARTDEGSLGAWMSGVSEPAIWIEVRYVDNAP